MGVQTVNNNKFIAFSVDGEYESDISNGMAWGIKTKSDNQFYPIFYIKNFSIGPKNSDGGYGELVLSACDIVLDGLGTGILSGNVKIWGDPATEKLYFQDILNNHLLMTVTPDSGAEYGITILDKIKFFANQAGSNSLKIGDGDNNRCLFTDDGYIYANNIDCNNLHCDNFPLIINENIDYINGAADNYISLLFKDGGHVYVYASNSDKNLKKNIKNSSAKAIEVIKKIRHVAFNWKSNNKHQEIGYIAQEMKEIDENFTRYNKFKTPEGEEKEDWQINTLAVLATATKAIQEQQEEIENLKAIINKQQEQINQILGGE